MAISTSFINQYQLQQCMKDFFRYKNKNSITMEEICSGLVEAIGCIPVNTAEVFIELGEPQEDILPLQKVG